MESRKPVILIVIHPSELGHNLYSSTSINRMVKSSSMLRRDEKYWYFRVIGYRGNKIEFGYNRNAEG
jgi:hypothetical protein